MDRVEKFAAKHGYSNEWPVYKSERHFNQIVADTKQKIVDKTHESVWVYLNDLIREMRQYYSYQLGLRDARLEIDHSLIFEAIEKGFVPNISDSVKKGVE